MNLSLTAAALSPRAALGIWSGTPGKLSLSMFLEPGFILCAYAPDSERRLIWPFVAAECTTVIETFVVAAIGIVVLVLYNRLVALGERCDQAFADIDVQLKQRHDLIPNLVHTVRDFVGHERGALDALMKARAAAMTAPTPAAQMQAESMLSSRLGQLIAVVEANPQLQSSAHFAALREEIADLENKIAAARRFLNMVVTEHNTALRQFPLNLLARPLRLSARNFYDLGADRVFLDEAPSAKL